VVLRALAFAKVPEPEEVQVPPEAIVIVPFKVTVALFAQTD
jgi:hypothetical protein